MKIAIPTNNSRVDDHFGHCEIFTIYTISSSNQVVSVEQLPSPEGCGCKSNIASILREMEVQVMLAGNMGNGALNVLHNNGIQVFRGCSGDIDNLVNDYLQGKLHDSGTGCRTHEHHSHGHQCNH